MNDSIERTITKVFSLYEQFGKADYIGEPVSQIEHMSQSAQLAMNDGYTDDVILAAFFHDIGHLCVSAEAGSMNGYGVRCHEHIGGDYLRLKGFPEHIARLVENHVQAKRYLTFKYPEYYLSLSEASKNTLDFQGGMMSAEEAALFERDPLFHVSIAMRRWDELAKEENLPLIELNLMKHKARLVLQNHQSSMP